MGRKPKAAWRCAMCSAYASESTPRSRHKKALCEDCYDGLAPRGLAWCSRGGHRVKAEEIHRYSCRACLATAQRERYHADPAAARARVAAERRANPERERQRKHEQRARNRERINARMRERRAADPVFRERCNATTRRYRHSERGRRTLAAWVDRNRLQCYASTQRWRGRRKLRILRGLL